MRTDKKERFFFFLGYLGVCVFACFFFFFLTKTRYREKQREANEIWARTGSCVYVGNGG